MDRGAEHPSRHHRARRAAAGPGPQGLGLTERTHSIATVCDDARARALNVVGPHRVEHSTR